MLKGNGMQLLAVLNTQALWCSALTTLNGAWSNCCRGAGGHHRAQFPSSPLQLWLASPAQGA